MMQMAQLPPALRDREQHAQVGREQAIGRRAAEQRAVQMDVRDGVGAPAHREAEPERDQPAPERAAARRGREQPGRDGPAVKQRRR